MPCAVSVIAGPTHRRFTKISGMPAKAALIYASFRHSVKWQAHVFQILNYLNGFLYQYLGRLLIDQINHLL